jgi:hypothetical protein
MMYMIRKQLYLEDHQDAQLKRRARELGVSEAEVVRRALEDALRGERPRLRPPGRDAAVARLRSTWRTSQSTLPARLDRDALYAERADRVVVATADSERDTR